MCQPSEQIKNSWTKTLKSNENIEVPETNRKTWKQQKYKVQIKFKTSNKSKLIVNIKCFCIFLKVDGKTETNENKKTNEQKYENDVKKWP
jgi:hypothetical protein